MTEKEVSKKLIAEYYCLHLDEIRTYVLKRTECSAESEDMVQNIFLRLLQSDKMISAVTLPCLVYCIARNMISDYWRHKQAVMKHERYIMQGIGAYINNKEQSSVYSMAEINELLERGMARLSDKSRSVYSMNVIEGMRVSEISQTLNENYKSVENRLGTARKEIRCYMKRILA